MKSTRSISLRSSAQILAGIALQGLLHIFGHALIGLGYAYSTHSEAVLTETSRFMEGVVGAGDRRRRRKTASLPRDLRSWEAQRPIP